MFLNNIEAFRTYCLSKPGTTEGFPFDESILVFKVMGKMFSATNVNSEEFSINLKCDPTYAIELRDEYENIQPGYHMNKKHWNSVFIDDSISSELVKELIDHSYDLVVKGLKKADKEILKNWANYE